MSCPCCSKSTHASESNDEGICAGCIEPVAIMYVTRESADLGLDFGTRVHVLFRDERAMVLYVPSLDMTIADVAANHPDLTEES